MRHARLLLFDTSQGKGLRTGVFLPDQDDPGKGYLELFTPGLVKTVTQMPHLADREWVAGKRTVEEVVWAVNNKGLSFKLR